MKPLMSKIDEAITKLSILIEKEIREAVAERHKLDAEIEEKFKALTDEEKKEFENLMGTMNAVAKWKW